MVTCLIGQKWDTVWGTWSYNVSRRAVLKAKKYDGGNGVGGASFQLRDVISQAQLNAVISGGVHKCDHPAVYILRGSVCWPPLHFDPSVRPKYHVFSPGPLLCSPQLTFPWDPPTYLRLQHGASPPRQRAKGPNTISKNILNVKVCSVLTFISLMNVPSFPSPSDWIRITNEI